MSTDTDSLRTLTLGLRGLLELGVLVAVGYWGLVTGEGTTGIVLGLAAVLAVVVVWGVAGSPATPGQLSETGKLALTAVLFGVGALALASAVGPTVGGGFAVLAALDTALLYGYGWE